MNLDEYNKIVSEVRSHNARLVAVSKTRSANEIMALYNQGQRIFGENKVQELCEKQPLLPKDIEWHLIGHLQSNKVKYIAPFVSMIHSADSYKLLAEIDKQAQKQSRRINCLLQVHIASEDTKFGFSTTELLEMLNKQPWQSLQHVNICGLMGMATNTDNILQLHKEFAALAALMAELKQSHFKNNELFTECSMGMSSDYPIALQHGATLIRVGSAIFGDRTY